MAIERTLSQRRVYDGRILNVRVDEAILPNGKTVTREVIEHHGACGIVAFDEEGKLLMVRQYRYPYGEALLELPAGKLEYGEDPLAAGKRELKEETGASAKEYTDLGKLYPSPGYCGEIIHMYMAAGLTFGEAAPDEDEFLELERIPLERAAQMVLDNRIRDAKTQAAVLKVYLKMKAGV